MRKYMRFTDGRIFEHGTMFCIGSNYALHAKEMGGEVPDEPVIFIKPPQAFVESGSKIVLPSFCDLPHHELELVVAIGKDCNSVSRHKAHKYIAGYAVGLDLTLRDIQNKAKKEGKPWAVAKGFYNSAPISSIVPVDALESVPPDFDIYLKVNGELKQSCNTSEMERSVSDLIEYLSKVFTLRAGDLIFTGTPAGVGTIKSGDLLYASLDGLANLEVTVE